MAKLAIEHIVTPGHKVFKRRELTDAQKERSLKEFRKAKDEIIKRDSFTNDNSFIIGPLPRII